VKLGLQELAHFCNDCVQILWGVRLASPCWFNLQNFCASHVTCHGYHADQKTRPKRIMQKTLQVKWSDFYARKQLLL